MGNSALRQELDGLRPSSLPLPRNEGRAWRWGRLDEAELRRRFWHMAPGLLPFPLLALVHAVFIPIWLRVVLAFVITGWLVALLFGRAHAIRRHGEQDLTASILGYALPVLGTILLFPSHLEIGFTVWVILAFGDGSATLGGLVIAGRRLPWNNRKSWAGFLSFMMVGGFFAALVDRLAVGVGWPSALAYGMGISLVCALMESLPSGLNDNPRVGVTASACAIAAYWLHAMHPG